MQTQPMDQTKQELPAPAIGAQTWVVWRIVALLSLVGCIFCEVLFNLLPIDHDTLLLYWFYPAALLLASQMIFQERITKHLPIKLLLVTLLWSSATVVLNFRRAQLVDSYTWFAAATTALFLCFSISYAYHKKELERLLALLAGATLLAVTLLSAAGLIAVFFEPIAAKLPSVFEGIGIWEGRLSLDTHPNRSAPAPALGVVLSILIFAADKKLWRRLAALLCGIICLVTLSLTVSRTAILAAGLAAGFMALVLLEDALRPRMHAIFRWCVCALAAVLVIFAVYQGAVLTAQACNTMIDRQQASTAQQERETTSITAVAERDLSDADSFNGRTDIWRGVFRGIQENPKILVFGTGPKMASEVMAPYFPPESPVGIFHNSLVGALVAYGVVGILLILAFLVLVAVAALRLSFGKQAAHPLALRLLPAVLLFAFAEGMMEDFLFANLSLNIVCVWFMIAAGLVLRQTGKEPKATPKEIAENYPQ